MDLVIRGGRVVTPGGVIEADVVVDGGRVVVVGEGSSESASETIDATGWHVMPGVIDSHVHFNEPGRTEWEGIDTGSAALVAGGGTCFFDMPLNSDPPVLDGETFDAKRAAGEASSRADFGLWGGLTPTNVDRLDELADRGVVGFKAFMSYSGIDEFARADDDTLRRGMRIAAARGVLVGVHAESEAITARLTAEHRAAGRRGWRDYLDSRPVEAELEAVDRAVAIAGETGCRLHVVHASHPRVVERVRLARERDGVDVTAETCPHYLVLTGDDLERLGGRAKCAPPLRDADAADGLWDALRDGVLSFVASDHSPCLPAMKQGDDAFAVWGGIAGVQSTLSVMLDTERGLDLPTVTELTAGRVAHRYGLVGKGKVAAGYDADLVLVDLSTWYELGPDMLLDRHRLNPYVGRTFRGEVRRTLLRGRTVWQGGRLMAPPMGRLIKPGGDR
ncbi:MAG: allantoinase AllB [Planctomycetota bacterium]